MKHSHLYNNSRVMLIMLAMVALLTTGSKCYAQGWVYDKSTIADRNIILADGQLDSEYIYMTVVPDAAMKMSSTKYKLLVDNGVNYLGMQALEYEGKPLFFLSPMAGINWLVSQGWELVEVFDYVNPQVEKGMVGDIWGTSYFMRRRNPNYDQ